MGNYYPNQAGTYNLGASIGSTDTSILLSSFTEPVSGTPYTMSYLNTSICYGTIQPTTSNSELISFTGITQNANGTALLTGVTRGLQKAYPFTSSATFQLSHPGQSIFILSDAPQVFQQFVPINDNVTINGLVTFAQPPVGINPGGQPNASSTVIGVTKLSVDPVSNVNPIALGQNDPLLLTPNSGTALNSSSNKIEDFDDTSATAANGKLVRANGSGIIDSSFLTGIPTAYPIINYPFGDGTDGSQTFDGTTTILGLIPSTSVYTLTRDIYLTTGVINNGVSIITAGYRIYASISLSNAGTIKYNGNNGGNASGGTGGSAGAALSNGTLFGAVAGQAGPNGVNQGGSGSNNPGTAGTAVSSSIGVSGVAGGIGGGGTTNGGGTATASNQGIHNIIFALSMLENLAGTISALKGSAGSASGAGGSGGYAQQGGGGGSASSGGIVWISAKVLTNTGTISANGGVGGTGGAGGAGGGGGGGGSGGVVILIYHTVTLGTVTVTGGAGGTGPGGNGVTGNTGIIYQFAV
jgi:hypothetical protein